MRRPVSDETFRPAGETIFQPREAVRKPATSISGLGQQWGFRHVCVHPQLNLPRSSRKLSLGHGKLGGKVMTEVVTAVLVFFSVGVFLAHAFDAYRTGAVGTRNPR